MASFDFESNPGTFPPLVGAPAPDVSRFLRRVAVLACGVASTPSSCGITLCRREYGTTLAGSDDWAEEADVIQSRAGCGPSQHAITLGEVVHVPDLAADSRWQEYRRPASAHGIRSLLSLPLTVDQQPTGAVTLYTGDAHTFTPPEIAAASAFTRQASVALALALDYAEEVSSRELRGAVADPW